MRWDGRRDGLLPGITAGNALCLSVRRVSFRSSPVQQVESLGQRDRVNRYTGGRKAEREEAIGSSYSGLPSGCTRISDFGLKSLASSVWAVRNPRVNRCKSGGKLEPTRQPRRETRVARSKLDCLKPNPERMIEGPAETLVRRRRGSGADPRR